MNFMGMGVMELGVIFLVCFLVLGPARSITMARQAGKILGDLKRTFSELANSINLEQMEQSVTKERDASAADDKDKPPQERT